MNARPSAGQWSPAGTKQLLACYSVEVTPGDTKSIAMASMSLQPGTEVFIASLPSLDIRQTVETAICLHQGGLVPVPHLAARNLASLEAVSDALMEMSQKAGADRALVIAGDRPEPLGELHDSLQILKSDVLRKAGLKKVYLSCYPEGHPTIERNRLKAAMQQKLDLVTASGLRAEFVSQFAFEAEPYIQMARELRQAGIQLPIRAGLAAPASPATLLKYAMMCGVGPSIRALRNRTLTSMHVGQQQAADVLRDLGAMNEREGLFESLHFFTFGSLARTRDFVAEMKEACAD